MRHDLEGLTIAGAGGFLAAVNGVPDEVGGVLSLQWCYRGGMMLCSLAAGLTVAQVTAELTNRMASIDDAADLAALVGEVL